MPHSPNSNRGQPEMPAIHTYISRPVTFSWILSCITSNSLRTAYISYPGFSRKTGKPVIAVAIVGVTLGGKTWLQVSDILMEYGGRTPKSLGRYLCVLSRAGNASGIRPVHYINHINYIIRIFSTYLLFHSSALRSVNHRPVTTNQHSRLGLSSGQISQIRIYDSDIGKERKT